MPDRRYSPAVIAGSDDAARKNMGSEMSNTNSMTRRAALGGAALGAGAIALGGTQAMAQAGGRKTFVLIHGAWHGGWCWRRVADLLEAKGHKVFAPTLTGLADRSHLLSLNVTLDTHIADIANLFKWEDIKDACLVAHSYGGWPSSGALEQIGDRVAAAVWLDAFMPQNGERGLDSISPVSRKALEEATAKGEAGRKGPPAKAFSLSEKDHAWIDSKLTLQPNAIPMQPIKLTGARDKIAKKTYIRAPKYAQPAFDKALAACKADKTWRTFVAENSGHDVMVDQPAWLVDILLQVA
jgi:pimeloyl-ACP methyl ester carboxylesterase